MEFLSQPEAHAESDIHNGLLDNLRTFLVELGPSAAPQFPHFPQHGHANITINDPLSHLPWAISQRPILAPESEWNEKPNAVCGDCPEGAVAAATGN
jgi:hypothetical protein